jgi:hypothetical protein
MQHRTNDRSLLPPRYSRHPGALLGSLQQMGMYGMTTFADLNANGRVLGLNVGDWALLVGASSLLTAIIQLAM